MLSAHWTVYYSGEGWEEMKVSLRYLLVENRTHIKYLCININRSENFFFTLSYIIIHQETFSELRVGSSMLEARKPSGDQWEQANMLGTSNISSSIIISWRIIFLENDYVASESNLVSLQVVVFVPFENLYRCDGVPFVSKSLQI